MADHFTLLYYELEPGTTLQLIATSGIIRVLEYSIRYSTEYSKQ